LPIPWIRCELNKLNESIEMMLANYIKIAWRNLFRHKAYSIINIAGLAVGIAAALLIFIVVRYELSYDKFQPNYDRIYRVVTSAKTSDGGENHNPGVPSPAYDALKNDFPQFEKIAALVTLDGNQVTVLGNADADVTNSKKFIETSTISFTHPAYFDMFQSRWLAGDAQSLDQPGHVVLDQLTAAKYFGDWTKAMGRFLKLDNTVLLKVSGIVETVPENSDFRIGFFGSYNTLKQYPEQYSYSPDWGSLSSSHQVYVMLPPQMSAASVSQQLGGFVKKYHARDGRRPRTLSLQSLRDIHFDSRYGSPGDHQTSKTILLTLALIGVLIIVMASINFVNLSTAQSLGRSREVGIRKVLGSNRAQLIRQVLGETTMLVFFAAILAVAIAAIAMPYLSKVASVPSSISLLTKESIFFMILLVCIVSLLSGFYPALVVSGFRPVLALKNKISSANLGGISLRRVLVVTQFAISQVLIIGTIVAVSQMNFVRQADLGFNKEALYILPAYGDSINQSRMRPLKQQLLQVPYVSSVSFGSDEASSDNNWASNFAFDHKEDEDYAIFHKFGDEDYAKTYGLKIIAGRNITPSDTLHELMINETLVKRLGLKDPQQAVGKDLRIGGGEWLPVVGVVQDFKANSLREETKPLMIGSHREDYYTAAVKLKTTDLARATAQIQKIWEQTYPEYAYTAHFADETIERFYRQETQLSLLYKIFAGIAIFISCLGLYGLVSFMAAQKVKEVGIRKVLGASVGNIVIMFSREFTILISIACIIAIPVAWYFMHDWLENFAYKIQIGAWVFIIAISSSLAIAWITVGYRAFRAAVANPVKSLRTE
jgi:putative ABC transport system permease protein